MAISFSENQLNYARKKFYGKLYAIKPNLGFIDKLINKILIYIYLLKFTLVNFKRWIFKIISFTFSSKNDNKTINFSYNLEEDLIQKASKDLKLKNFTFVENFLSPESYKYLNENWPNINYFKHHKQIIKHFSSGFRHKKENPIEKTFNRFNNYFALRKFYEYLLSNEFNKFYNKLISFENDSYELDAISSKMASKDSYLIPHIDGVFKKDKKSQHYNFIYFLDGYDENPDFGGATGFYKDNEFKSPIFIPHTIRNSLVIYNQCHDFYHGFKAIDCPKGIYRKTVGFQIKPKQ
jgi:hypothetical protein